VTDHPTAARTIQQCRVVLTGETAIASSFMTVTRFAGPALMARLRRWAYAC
jgi:hypothetical protein